MTLPLPDWMPWWVQLVLLTAAILFGVALLMMPFAVFGVKGRLSMLESQLEDVHAELRMLAMRLPEPERPARPTPAVTVDPEPPSYERTRSPVRRSPTAPIRFVEDGPHAIPDGREAERRGWDQGDGFDPDPLRSTPFRRGGRVEAGRETDDRRPPVSARDPREDREETVERPVWPAAPQAARRPEEAPSDRHRDTAAPGGSLGKGGGRGQPVGRPAALWTPAPDHDEFAADEPRPVFTRRDQDALREQEQPFRAPAAPRLSPREEGGPTRFRTARSPRPEDEPPGRTEPVLRWPPARPRQDP
ncbi:hypothetical protein [Rhizosaccharibacter radicis]|uniref:DUF2339 domain-containing protein n=1 Tax=Rhizosaccharibacter radicis TaxID=2782605 RepID=A0ABT1VY44_9PROT|nr:hypothetical protein [Acetobacteraceae bacterium KSS12]